MPQRFAGSPEGVAAAREGDRLRNGIKALWAAGGILSNVRAAKRDDIRMSTSSIPVSSSAVVVVGSFNIDHVWTLDALPARGETRSGEYSSGPGGKGFNQAIASVRSGAATRFICALGSDTGGALARALAAADGLDLVDACSAAPTGTAGIFVDAAGRNSIVVAPGANATLDVAHVEQSLASSTALAVVLVQLENPVAVALCALTLAHAAGALAMLNPAPANVVIPCELLTQVDVLTPNETEFVALLASVGAQQVAADDVARMTDDDLHDLCRQLLALGTVVITLGAAGCFVSHAPTQLRGDVAPFYRVAAAAADAIDTTGAGDAFNGALAAAFALDPTRAFADHVRYATAYAGRSTERAGAARAMPFRAEIEPA